ncbi:hypothetical protein [Aquimarina spongiae]|uniref:DUF4294 domain-containing protein n=1 Tax=Aquimarina spongiae TaxID=570521 RepID=A0A1M6CXV4_9FLAO|nr:hypothetical protein [Aquimarina spongiae]SHI65790.1 hypothetical protein SAMN04488508_102337 [Aquimarina spongiae]
MRFSTLLITFLITLSVSAQSSYDESPNRYRFKYKSELYKGTRLQITSQLRKLKNDSKFTNIPEEIEQELHSLFIATKKQPIPKYYKKRAYIFLDALYAYEDFANIYENALYQVVRKVKKDMYVVDFKFERQFTKAKVALDRYMKEDYSDIERFDQLKKELIDSQTKLASHRWMKGKFENYDTIEIVKHPDELMGAFKKSAAVHVYRLYNDNNIAAIKPYLENQIIDFYYKKSLPEINPESFDLQYITKI